MKTRQFHVWGVAVGLLAAATWCPQAVAVPAPPGLTKVAQPDGTALAVRAYGDEHGLFFEAEDGYTVIRDAGGTWRYAVRGRGGKLAPSDLRAGQDDPRSLGVAPHERHDDATMQEIERTRREANTKRHVFHRLAKRKALIEEYATAIRAEAAGAEEDESAHSYPGMTPAPAEFRLAILLMEFPAKEGNPAVLHTYEPAQIEQMLLSANSYVTTPGGKAAYGSMRDYIHAMSGGQFSLTGQVFGWQTATESKAYYDLNGDRSLLEEAIAKSGVNVANFDGFALIYAGAEGSNQLWPHAYMGVSQLSYTMSEKFYSEDLADIGVHTHEFAHLLGLWDLYELPGSIGTWGLMGYGCYGGNGGSGERPVQLLGLEKEMLGWVTPTVIGKGSHSLSIPASATAGAVYKVVSERSYFYLENRQQQGYDLYLPGKGLTVWHVDMTATNVVSPAPARIDMEEADGSIAHSGTAGAPFPGSTGNTAFGCASAPSSTDYDGSCSVSLSRIEEEYGVVEVDVSVAWRSGGGITVGGVSYPTLFTAINSALPGQTVSVAAGTYTERVQMRRGIDVAGAGPGKSILQDVSTPVPGAFFPILVAGADDTLLSGFSLKGGNYLSSNYGQEGAGYDMADTTFSYARVSNCAFIGFAFGVNTTHMYGSPSISPGSLEVTNNYFERNSTAVAMWYRGMPTVKNNILVGNSQGVQRVFDGAIGSVDYNTVYNNQTDFANVYAPELGTHNLSADPRLVAAAQEDYRLQSSSPSINAGDPAVIYNDTDGTRNDMGVYGGPLAPIAPLSIITSSLPSGSVNVPYSQSLVAAGGKAPRTWNVSAGSLPTGLSLASSTAVISGTPTAGGTFNFTVRVTDANSTVATKDLSIAIAVPNRPDLVVTTVSGPTSGTRGRKVTVSATVKNQGQASAAASTLSFYLSTDATITTGDKKLSDVSVTSLAIGASKSVNSSVTLPTSLAAGSYYIGAIADRAAVVTESNESNNWKAGNTITLR